MLRAFRWRLSIPPCAWRWALALGLAAGSCLCAAADPRYELTVSLDPAAHALRGHAVITLSTPAPVQLTLARRFTVDSFTVDGRPGPAPASGEDAWRWTLAPGAGHPRVTVAWHGTLEPLDAGLDARGAITQAAAVSSSEGSFLPASSAWYPVPRGVLHTYELTLEMPPGQRGLVPGDLVEERESTHGYFARFAFPAPAEGIDLMAGPYVVEERRVHAAERTLRLRTYFHPAIAELASGYLDATAGYLALYEQWIGPYPFGSFSIVSSATPTGFGMPSLTYLGVDVLRLPFIRSTSLGHEILHNWWGNGVYVDYEKGNWAEGLTTFMADYTYRERKGEAEARSARLEWLRDFAVLPAAEDRPLAQFVSRDHDATQVIGYGKAAMVFLMLRDIIGTSAFDAGVRKLWESFRFRKASWDDLRAAFEAASGHPLGPFFTQWVERSGAPRLRIGCADGADGSTARVALTLEQDSPPFRVRVPVSIHTQGKADETVLDLRAVTETFDISIDGPPQEIALDPGLRVFRRLDTGEVPPILRRVMVDSQTSVVLAGSAADAQEAAAGVARALLEAPRFDDTALPAPGASMVLIGLEDDVDRWLIAHGMSGMPEALRGKGDAVAWAVPLERGGELVSVAGRDTHALALLARPLPHYGRRSFVVFSGGKLVESGLVPMPTPHWVPGAQSCEPAQRPG